jgi:hypothetical protein
LNNSGSDVDSGRQPQREGERREEKKERERLSERQYIFLFYHQ